MRGCGAATVTAGHDRAPAAAIRSLFSTNLARVFIVIAWAAVLVGAAWRDIPPGLQVALEFLTATATVCTVLREAIRESVTGTVSREAKASRNATADHLAGVFGDVTRARMVHDLVTRAVEATDPAAAHPRVWLAADKGATRRPAPEDRHS